MKPPSVALIAVVPVELKVENEYAVVPVAVPSVIVTCANVWPALSVKGPAVSAPEFAPALIAATGTDALAGVALVTATVAVLAAAAAVPVLATVNVTLNALPGGVVVDAVVAFWITRLGAAIGPTLTVPLFNVVASVTPPEPLKKEPVAPPVIVSGVVPLATDWNVIVTSRPAAVAPCVVDAPISALAHPDTVP